MGDGGDPETSERVGSVVEGERIGVACPQARLLDVGKDEGAIEGYGEKAELIEMLLSLRLLLACSVAVLVRVRRLNEARLTEPSRHNECTRLSFTLRAYLCIESGRW